MCYDLKLVEKCAYPNNNSKSYVFSLKGHYAIYILNTWK